MSDPRRNNDPDAEPGATDDRADDVGDRSADVSGAPPPPTAEASVAAAAEHRAAAAEHRAHLAEERLDETRRTPNDDDDVEEVRRKPTYGLGSLLALIGAAGIAVSVFLSWAQDPVQPTSDTFSAVDVPTQFLWDKNADLTDAGFSLLFVLGAAVVLVLVGVFIPRARWAAWLGGLVALAVAVLYTISAGRRLSADDSNLGAFDWIDVGTWVCAIAAAVAIIGVSLLPRKEIVTRR